MGIQIGTSVDSEALQVYGASEVKHARNYQMVKAATLKRDNISAESYQRRFRMAKKKGGQSYRELALRLQDSAKNGQQIVIPLK